MRDALGSVQRILLLGGTSEIGLAIVDELAAGGRVEEVVLACRRPADVAELLDRWAYAGATARPVAFDACEPGRHRDVLADARAGGDVDVVIAAVGQLGDEARLRDDPVAAARLLEVNLAGTAAALLAAAEALTTQGHGTLVVLSSVAGVRVRADNFVYGASKAGLDGFAQGLADSLEGTGVDVVIVRPGFVRTRMTEGVDEAPFSTDSATVGRLVVEGMAAGRRVVWAPRMLRWVFLVLANLPGPLWRMATSAARR